MQYKTGMTIGEVLGKHLRDAGLTQEAAADKLGVKQSIVSRWIRGIDTPSDRYVPALARLTGLTEAQVLEACHHQRMNRPLGDRVSALEAEMTEIKAGMETLLRSLPRDKR